MKRLEKAANWIEAQVREGNSEIDFSEPLRMANVLRENAHRSEFDGAVWASTFTCLNLYSDDWGLDLAMALEEAGI